MTTHQAAASPEDDEIPDPVEFRPPPNNLRWVVDAYYQLQKFRIATGNQILARERLVDQPAVPPSIRMTNDRLAEIEALLAADFSDALQGHLAMNWLGQIKGVGPVLAGKLLGLIGEIELAETVSKLWRFAGYAVIDGKRERPTKGEKLHYNNRLKAACYLVSASFLKCGSPYRTRSYDPARLFYLRRATGQSEAWCREQLGLLKAGDPPTKAAVTKAIKAATLPDGWTLGHQHMAAMRKMTKLFLGHLWLTWREAEGLPIREAYVQEKLGHSSIIGPWEMVKDAQAATPE